jgi:tetraacyldisaccharide 4'-kinase
VGAWHLLLWPLSLVYGALAALRFILYRYGILKPAWLPVPVIVVGNISVGGTGKTPLVVWLVAFLRRQGFVPGVVSRGYGGAGETRAVLPDDTPGQVGDEPLLIARRAGCPVWVGRDRVGAARRLLAAHRECNVLVADDGLQHYRLGRDVEIAVLDQARGFGNGLLVPAGPLRDGKCRLATVDAVVENGDGTAAPGRHAMTLQGGRFRNLADPGREAGAAEFAGQRLHALAGIGNPARFFAHLQALGLDCETHAFPDHHAYVAGDLVFGNANAILMTEKDAVKCAAYADERMWYLPVEACLDEAFGEKILQLLRKRHG